MLDDLAFHVVPGIIASVVDARVVDKGLRERKKDVVLLGQGLRSFPVVSIILILLGFHVIFLVF